MPKMTIDRKTITSEVLPSLDSSKTCVDKARANAQRVSAPYDFAYRSRYNSFVTNINNMSRDLSDIDSWLKESVNSLNIIEKELQV